MKLRWLRPFVVLAAACIVSITNIVCKRPMVTSLVLLLLTILVFFFIGSLCTRIIDRTMNAVPPQDDHTENIDVETEEETE